MVFAQYGVLSNEPSLDFEQHQFKPVVETSIYLEIGPFNISSKNVTAKTFVWTLNDVGEHPPKHVARIGLECFAKI